MNGMSKFQRLTTIDGADPMGYRLGEKVLPLEEPSKEDFRLKAVQDFECGEWELPGAAHGPVPVRRFQTEKLRQLAAAYGASTQTIAAVLTAKAIDNFIAWVESEIDRLIGSTTESTECGALAKLIWERHKVGKYLFHGYDGDEWKKCRESCCFRDGFTYKF